MFDKRDHSVMGAPSCVIFGRGLEAVDYEARGEGCEGSQQKVLSLLHHRAPSSLGGLVTASPASLF